MPLPERNRSRPSSGDRAVLSEILRSVKSFELRLRKIEDDRRLSTSRASGHRSRSTRRQGERSSSRHSEVSCRRRRRRHSRRRIRRRIVSSSSGSARSRSRGDYHDDESVDMEAREAAQCSPRVEYREERIDVEQVMPGQPMQTIVVQDNGVQIPQNRDLQSLLGDECAVPTPFAPSLHIDIASRWDVILRRGLDSNKRAEVIERYAPPENCKNVIPPNLNLHVKGALSESNEKRDVRLANLQQQVGAGIAAIGKILSSLYQKGGEGDRENIQALSDAGRLFADVHYQETMSRRDLVLLNINKDLRDTLSNSPPDEWLFGSNLEEVIKAKKNIDISSQQLKSKKVFKKPSQPVTKSLNSIRPFRSYRGAYRSGQQPRQAPRSKIQLKQKQNQSRNRDRRQ